MDDQLLQGEWTASIADRADAAMLYLGPHPEWQGMVKGEVERAGQRHAMVGDMHDGIVTLEESANGTNISATWTGDVADGSCSHEIRGQYQEGEDAPIQTFVLRKRSP